jgi:hypothetical protein
MMANGESDAESASIEHHKKLYTDMQQAVHKRMKEHQGELEARYKQRIQDLEEQLLAVKQGCDCENKKPAAAEPKVKAAVKAAVKPVEKVAEKKKEAVKVEVKKTSAEPVKTAAPQQKEYTFVDKPLGISLSLLKTKTGRQAIVVKKVKRVGTPIEVGDELLFLDKQDVKAWKLNDVMKELKKGKMPITMRFGPNPDAPSVATA